MWFMVRGVRHSASSLAEVSRLYASLRDGSGEGMRTWPSPTVYDDTGASVGRLSYNAKVWADKEWERGDAPLYSPYA